MVLEMEMSKTYQYRKVMKPMLERKRRARINKCLDDLKDLLVDCLRQEGEHITRLEKADILELTVDYLKKTSLRTINVEATPESFRVGYVHAANEVSKVLASSRGVDMKLGTTLMTHLGSRLNQLQAPKIDEPRKPATTVLNIQVSSCHCGPLSPSSSSGYHSSLCSPSASESSMDFCGDMKNEDVWRPW